MKSTLSDIRQLFNVLSKGIVYGVTGEQMTDGQFAIFAEGSATSIPNTVTTFADMPDKFMFVSKLNGKVYFSQVIDKTCCRLEDVIAKPYQPEIAECWKTLIEHCECIKGVELHINIDEQSLIQRDGLTWTHKDFVVDIAPEELRCLCGWDCSSVKGVYENHLITQLLYQRVNALNSPFYEAKVQLTDGTQFADEAAVQAYIDANKAVNTDDDDTNDSLQMELVICGKVQGSPTYNDLEVNYVFPRGVKLNPIVRVNGDKNFTFTQTQALQYEVGAGYDLRHEEFENMNLYTDLNYYPQLSDGIKNPAMVYQFENGKNYNTLTLHFGVKKSGIEDVYEGRYRQAIVVLATDDAAEFATLQTLLTPTP